MPRDGAPYSLLACTSGAADCCRDDGDEKPPMRPRPRPRYEHFEQPTHDDEPPDPAPADGWEPPQPPWRTGLPAEHIHNAPEEQGNV